MITHRWQNLEKYIDFDKLRPKGNPNTCLILTAVNILTAESLTFDSYKQQITPKHILATSTYPLYNFPGIEVKDGVFTWDGGLLSNTPLRDIVCKPILVIVIKINYFNMSANIPNSYIKTTSQVKSGHVWNT